MTKGIRRKLPRSGRVQDGPHCHDEHHETPCPLPCLGCKADCDPDTWFTREFPDVCAICAKP